jgi:hypothetical protein
LALYFAWIKAIQHASHFFLNGFGIAAEKHYFLGGGGGREIKRKLRSARSSIAKNKHPI